MNGGEHSWENMTDEEILKSAGFYGVDRTTGEKGINLAGIMVLGKDNVIKDVTSGYCTDAIYRVENVDRYDDRQYIDTNLIESYWKLLDFTAKHLPDPFYLEGNQRISLRGILTREMISNLLIHREFASAYPAKFVIEKDKMFTQNANRATGLVEITIDNFEPCPKNPIIASFFRVIGLADTLGSGVRNLFKYAQHYQHSRPEMIEHDIFQTTVYFRAFEELEAKNQHKHPYVNPTAKPTTNGDSPLNSPLSSPLNSPLSDMDKSIMMMMQVNPKVRMTDIAEKLGVHRDTIKIHIKSLAERHLISRLGAKKNGSWTVNVNIDSVNS